MGLKQIIHLYTASSLPESYDRITLTSSSFILSPIQHTDTHFHLSAKMFIQIIIPKQNVEGLIAFHG